MNLSETFDESDGQETERLLLTDVAYVTESDGHRVDTPVLHCRCRTASGALRTLEIEGFRPYLYISMAEFQANPLGVLNDRRVLGVDGRFDPDDWRDILPEGEGELVEDGGGVATQLGLAGSADVHHTDDPVTSLDGDELVRVIVKTPGGVGGGRGASAIRDHFDETWEADIPFVRRFLISSGIHRGIEAPTASDRLRYENWRGESSGSSMVQDVTACDPPEADTRVCTFDIEVATNDDGFPEPHRAKNPITAISAHDSYRDEYRLWALIHSKWSKKVLTDGHREEFKVRIVNDVQSQFDFEVSTDQIELFADETELLDSFHDWFLDCDPDLVTGWNSSGFDVPYIIQRSYNVNALSIREWATVGKPGVWAEEYDGETTAGYSVQGRSTLDTFDAYVKTQYRDLDSYKLDDVASAELGVGKVGLDGDELDEAWSDHPVEFFTYSLRDTDAVVGIEREVGLLDLYENLREVTGSLYETCNNNGPMIDTLFLRRAYEDGYALPTNTEPDENVYHGAKVFSPVAGVHRNCVYPDLSSMYPNLFAMLNLGTETIIGTREDLVASEYTEADCFTFPVDNREFATVPKGESYEDLDRDEYKGVKSEQGGVREMFDAQYDWLFVLKPDVRESFIRSTIDELIELKADYSGDMYAAVKRVVNSCYGVCGDSESGGKGFRLYDRRVAEGITLAGRLTISHTAEEFTDYIQTKYDNNAQLIGGDTDSCVTSIPDAPTLGDARSWSEEAVDHVEDSYDLFVTKTFDFDDDDNHRLAVDLESLASTLFFMEGESSQEYIEGDDGLLHREETSEAVRKRYAQHIVWDEDDGWLADDLADQEAVTYPDYENGALTNMDPTKNVGIKGFEYVRSDSAQITRDAQLQVLTDILLASDPRERIEEYLTTTIDGIRNGEVPLGDLAKPKGMSQQLDEYGWKDADELDDCDGPGRYVTTPAPTYRGAKFADEHFAWESLGPGAKPKKLPIERVRSDDYPAVYTYESYPQNPDWPDPPEVGDEVDALAVEYPDRVPDGFVVDTETIIEKALEDKLRAILATINLSWDDLLANGQQATLGNWEVA